MSRRRRRRRVDLSRLRRESSCQSLVKTLDPRRGVLASLNVSVNANADPYWYAGYTATKVAHVNSRSRQRQRQRGPR